MDQAFISAIIVVMVTIFFAKSTPIEAASPEPLSTYQGCMACTSKGNTFQVNMKNQEAKCSKTVWSTSDSVEVTDEKKCEIFNPPTSHHSSHRTPPPLLGSNSTRRAGTLLGQEDTLTLACHCAPCPTTPVSTERVAMSSLTLFQQCVLCTENQRHFRVNLKSHDTSCYESPQQTSDTVVVSKIASCEVLSTPCTSEG